MVADLVVVNVSNTKAARDNLLERGVDEYERSDERRWERIVVLPEPDSPLRTKVSLACVLNPESWQSSCTIPHIHTEKSLLGSLLFLPT